MRGNFKLSPEEIECRALVEYLDIRGLKYSHLAQSTFTRSWSVKARNKAIGVRPGVPDYLIIVKNTCVFIEMKRKKGGVTSKYQKEWIEKLSGCNGVIAMVCAGAEEAISVIQKVEKTSKK